MKMGKPASFLLAVLLALLLALAGCAAESATPEERIEDMVKTLYTLPDEYHLDEKNLGNLFWGHAGENTAEALKAWEAHDRGRFRGEDFAPGVLEELTALGEAFASDHITALGILGPRYSRYHINRDFPVGLEKMLRWAGDASLSCSAVQSTPQEDELIWPDTGKTIVAHSGPTPGPPSPMP